MKKWPSSQLALYLLKACSRLVALHAAAILLLACLITPLQAAPLAGTSIGNQASATYTDASAVTRTATSNTVQTIVQQVAAVTLTSAQTKTGAPGGTVYFPHTLTNTGNGSDTFTLGTAVGGTVTLTSINIYPDANGDGVPDNFTPITSTGALAAGGVFRFIVAATIPGTATNGSTGTVTVTATGSATASPATSLPNIDTASVSGNAIIVMTKSVSPGSGNAGTAGVTYTLTYTNTGNATATSLTITDAVPAGMTYKIGNLATWSVSGGTALTDITGDVQSFSAGAYTIDYSQTAGTVTAIINKVLPGETRTLTFQVDVTGGAIPGVINNTANFSYNDNNGTGSTISGSSNQSPFTVNQTGGVVANGSNTLNTDGTGEAITVASALQGSTVPFDVSIWNTGNGSDSFDITVANTSFPAGTSFVLYKSDGVTPLVDTNGNSTPDTGTLAATASYKVVVKAILPAGTSGNNGGAGFSATLTATSKFDNTKTNPAVLTLSAIAANTVDLTLGTALPPTGTAAVGNAGSTGYGAYVNGSAALTPNKSAAPGGTVTYVLKVNNTSTTADTYTMAISTAETFAATTPPAGWTATFKADGGAGDCSTLGAVISNTGVINGGANGTVCAILNVPANATAGTVNLYFRALSPTSGAADRMRVAVDVTAVRSIVVNPSQIGQIFPGGTVIYPMTVTNNGNVPEGTAANAGALDGSNSLVTLSLGDSKSGWTSVVYHDANGNGTIDPADPVIANLSGIGGLAPGASIPLLVKVFAPAGAGIGDINTTTLTATVAGTIQAVAAPAVPSFATDNTTVISGQVTLVKAQALDALCDGTADGAFGQGNITTGAIPGACILYQITATNVGTASVSNLVISDATPANTVYATGAPCPGSVTGAAITGAGNTITATPAACSAGTVTATVPTLAPGASVVLSFGVRINP